MNKIVDLTLFDKLEEDKKRLEAQEYLLIKDALVSNNVDLFLKAEQYIKTIEEKDKSKIKSYVTDPIQFVSNFGFKDKPIQLSYATLRRMGAVPETRAIISTRVDQVSQFATPQENRNGIGFIFRKKRKYASKETDKELTKEELKRMDYLYEFILNCGNNQNAWHGNRSFDEFIRLITLDSLTLDQLTFEIIRNEKGELCEFIATDGATYRFADTFEENEDYNKLLNKDFKNNNLLIKNTNISRFKEEKGYYPEYVQIYQNNIVSEFYPWELCFGIRNQSTNIYKNGYGTSELEELVQVVTSMLYSFNYNSKFFSQGSSPKGILQVKGGTNANKLHEFRQQWQATVAGVTNSHKIPIIDSDTMNWVDLQKTNRDMEFSHWQEYLLKLTCALYKIDPSEIGFPMNASGTQSMFESNNANRLKYSKDKGLKPLLKFLQRLINKYLISQIDNDFEFLFVGMDADSESEELEMDLKKASSFMTLKEIRRKYNLPEEIEEDDVLLNSIWMQNKQLKMQTVANDNQSNPFEAYGDEDVEKSVETNPIMEDFNKWYEKEITQN